jgi:glycosyltransferase involved in cell wall biosynthesis
LHCVSAAQHATRPQGSVFLPPIENGVAAMPVRRRSAEYCLFVGRICAEKAVHLAIAAAKLAQTPLLIAGEVFPYPNHIRYFSEQVEPNLNSGCRFVGAVDPARKAELFASALCVLIPSLVEETSSLVAREAMAAGTPVVAFNRPALADIIEHRRTGYLVESVEQMADAIKDCTMIDREYCRAAARDRFPLSKMTSEYLRLYETIASGELNAADLQ